MKWLLIFILLFSFNNLFSQSYSYSYIDPCTGKVKSLNIPSGGNPITVNYYGTVAQFTGNDFNNGIFAEWINNVSAANSGQPCGEVVTILTTNVNMIVTQNIVSTVMNVTSIANIAQSMSSMGSSMSGGIGNSVNNGESGGNNNSKKYNKNGESSGSNNSGSSSLGNNNNSGGQYSNTNGQTQGDPGSQGQGSQINSNDGKGSQSTGSNGSSIGNGSSTNGNGNTTGAGNGNSQTNSPGQEQGGNVSSGSEGSGTGNSSSLNPGSNTESQNNAGSSDAAGLNTSGPGSTTNGGTSTDGTGTTPGGQESTGTAKNEGGGSSSNGISNSISNSEDNSGSGGSGNKNSGGSRTRTGSLIGTGDIVALRSAEDRNAANQYRFTTSLTRANTKSTKVTGLLANFTTGINNTNLTVYRARVIPQSQWTIIVANSSMMNFERDFFNTTTTLASKRFKGNWKKLTLMGGLNYTMGNLGDTKFGNLSAVGGGFYAYNIGKDKKISGSILCLAVYSPFTQFFEGEWWKSGTLLVPFNSWDYSITKKFKFNISISGVYQVNQNMLNYQILTGGKVML